MRAKADTFDIHNPHAVHDALKRLAGSVRVLLVNVARGTEQLETLRFEAANPTFLLMVGKSGTPKNG